MKNNNRGFTLIELMIAVAIIGILAAVAMPSYTQYVQRSHRVDAKNMLMSLAQRLEQNYSLSGSYNQTQDGATVNTALATTWGFGQSPSAGAARYNITLSTITANTYTVTATPTGAQTGDSCGALALTERNLKAAKGNDPNAANISRSADTVTCWSK